MARTWSVPNFLPCVVGRDDEVHVSAGDAVDGADGSGQLTFEGPLVVDSLAELRRGDPLLVEEGVALRATGGQTLGAHIEPQLVDLRLGYQHRGAAVTQLVAHPFAGQLLCDGAGVAGAEVAVQRRPGGLGGPLGEEVATDDDGRDGQTEHGLLPGGEPRPDGPGPAAGGGDVEGHRLRPPCS